MLDKNDTNTMGRCLDDLTLGLRVAVPLQDLFTNISQADVQSIAEISGVHATNWSFQFLLLSNFAVPPFRTHDAPLLRDVVQTP
jgi:hypothetical protein